VSRNGADAPFITEPNQPAAESEDADQGEIPLYLLSHGGLLFVAVTPEEIAAPVARQYWKEPLQHRPGDTALRRHKSRGHGVRLKESVIHGMIRAYGVRCTDELNARSSTKVIGVPMNADDVARQLEEIANAGDDFEYQSTQLTERWKNDVNGAEAVEPILRFMESHPDVEYGTPGALVHFVETFSGYEQKLVQSVERQPTPDTVGMLNRAINGERRDPKKRQVLLATLMRVLENPQADSMTRSRAFDYLEFQMRSTAVSERPQ
jgi:hypothetical protein